MSVTDYTIILCQKKSFKKIEANLRFIVKYKLNKQIFMKNLY